MLWLFGFYELISWTHNPTLIEKAFLLHSILPSIGQENNMQIKNIWIIIIANVEQSLLSKKLAFWSRISSKFSAHQTKAFAKLFILPSPKAKISNTGSASWFLSNEALHSHNECAPFVRTQYISIFIKIQCWKVEKLKMVHNEGIIKIISYTSEYNKYHNSVSVNDAAG